MSNDSRQELMSDIYKMSCGRKDLVNIGTNTEQTMNNEGYIYPKTVSEIPEESNVDHWNILPPGESEWWEYDYYDHYPIKTLIARGKVKVRYMPKSETTRPEQQTGEFVRVAELTGRINALAIKSGGTVHCSDFHKIVSDCQHNTPESEYKRGVIDVSSRVLKIVDNSIEHYFLPDEIREELDRIKKELTDGKD